MMGVKIMAIKTRVLVYPETGKIRSYGEAIYDMLGGEKPVDKIPPAYSCNNDRLVYIGVKVGRQLPDDLRLFCGSMDKSRATYVAIFANGDKATVDAVANTLREAGTQVVGETLYVDVPFLSFIKKLKPEEKEKIESWAKKIFDDVLSR
jgi:hypothetical protein